MHIEFQVIIYECLQNLRIAQNNKKHVVKSYYIVEAV